MSEHGFPRVLILRVKRHELLVRERVIIVDHVLADLLVLQVDVSIPLLALLVGGRGHGRVLVGAPEVVDVLPLLRASNVVLERAQVSPAIRRDLESEKLEEVLLVSAEVLLHVLDDASLVVAGIALEELCVLLQFLLAVLVQEQRHAAHDGLLRFSVSRVP